MKKITKNFLLLCGLLLLAAPLCGQSHLKGLNALEASAGMFGPQGGAYFVRGSFSHYISSKGYYKLSLQADHKAYFMEVSPAYSRRYLAGIDYMHAVLVSRSGGFYFNLAAGATGGYEHIHVSNLPAGMKPEGANTFVYGLNLGVESELFIKDGLALTLSLREMYLINSPLLKFRPYASVGLKWILLN